MMYRVHILTLIMGAMFLVQPVMAADISDEVTDVEEITADSEAAKAEAKEAKARVEQERLENAKELKSVRQARQSAQIKREEAATTLKRSETELGRLAVEQAQLNKDILRLNHETMVSERAISEAKAKIDKTKADTAALLAQKTQKQTSAAEANKQKMQLMRDVGMADDEFAIQTRALEKALSDEKSATAELEQTRAEEAVRKVATEAKIKDLKEQIQGARAQHKNLETDVRKYKAYNRRLEEQARVGAAELNQMNGGVAPAKADAETGDSSP